jgi:hypothetical protein
MQHFVTNPRWKTLIKISRLSWENNITTDLWATMWKCEGTQMIHYGEWWPSFKKARTCSVPWHESLKLLYRLKKYKISGTILYHHNVRCKFHYFSQITIPHISTDLFSLAHLTSQWTSAISHRICISRRNSVNEYLTLYLHNTVRSKRDSLLIQENWNTNYSEEFRAFRILPVNPLLKYLCADKSLARPTSRCISFDGENISFDASLVIYIAKNLLYQIVLLCSLYLL